MSARAWPVAREVPAGWCTIPTGTLTRGMIVCHLRPGAHPRRFIRPAVWMFATAWAPCLCASEARPSDRGIRCWGIRPHHFRYHPHVQRETVAAGRGFVPATTLHPGAGPASPDIASSGVSEGGTGMSLRGWKWVGMKKLCFVDFVAGFLKVVPLFWRLAPSLWLRPSLYPLPAGGERGCKRLMSRPSPRLRGERARRADEGQSRNGEAPTPPSPSPLIRNPDRRKRPRVPW